MREKEVEISVQKIIKIIWATVFLIIMVISVWIIFDCFRIPPDEEKQILNYNSSTLVDYKVYLKANNFYDKKYLDKNKKYVANIIDYIDINLNYNFNTSVLADSNYTYTATAVISSDYELNGVASELWSKSYQLVAPKSSTQNSSSSFSLRENLRIDYGLYDEMAKKFREEYGISSDTKLTIMITVNSSSKVETHDSPITETKKISLVMPLNRAVTDISVSGDEAVNKNITEVIKGERHINYVLLIGSIVLLAISAPVCIMSFYKLFKITNVSQYLVLQKKILRGYGDIIAEVTTKPDLRGLKTVEVREFEDLINIEEELRVPILFYEIPEVNESWFVITAGTQAYRYILK